jgi:hypothetical protein
MAAWQRAVHDQRRRHFDDEAVEAERPEPDLFIFGLLGSFNGYYPGYSRALRKAKITFHGRSSKPILETLPAA